MAIQDLIKKIIHDGEKEMLSIQEQAAFLAEKRFAEEMQKAVQQQHVLIEQARRTAAFRQEHVRVAEMMRERQELLLVKRAIMESVFKEVLQQLLQLPAEQYIQIIEHMVEQSLAQIEFTQLTVICSEDDRSRFGPAFEHRIERKVLSNKQKEPGSVVFLYDKALNGKGGVVMKTEILRIENTFLAFIENERPRLESRLAECLFEED